MLQLSGAILDKPVLSLQTGAPVGTTVDAIMNPNNLKIEGFHCQDRFEKQPKILLSIDVRDILPQGLVVNDHNALTNPEELIRLREILDLRFTLIGKPVYTVSKQRIGKVVDYAIDSNTLYVQKLYVARSILKSLNNGQLSVERTNIVEITNRKVVIQEIMELTKSTMTATAPAA